MAKPRRTLGLGERLVLGALCELTGLYLLLLGSWALLGVPLIVLGLALQFHVVLSTIRSRS